MGIEVPGKKKYTRAEQIENILSGQASLRKSLELAKSNKGGSPQMRQMAINNIKSGIADGEKKITEKKKQIAMEKEKAVKALIAKGLDFVKPRYEDLRDQIQALDLEREILNRQKPVGKEEIEKRKNNIQAVYEKRHALEDDYSDARDAYESFAKQEESKNIDEYISKLQGEIQKCEDNIARLEKNQNSTKTNTEYDKLSKEIEDQVFGRKIYQQRLDTLLAKQEENNVHNQTTS